MIRRKTPSPVFFTLVLFFVSTRTGQSTRKRKLTLCVIFVKTYYMTSFVHTHKKITQSVLEQGALLTASQCSFKSWNHSELHENETNTAYSTKGAFD